MVRDIKIEIEDVELLVKSRVSIYKKLLKTENTNKNDSLELFGQLIANLNFEKTRVRENLDLIPKDIIKIYNSKLPTKYTENYSTLNNLFAWIQELKGNSEYILKAYDSSIFFLQDKNEKYQNNKISFQNFVDSIKKQLRILRDNLQENKLKKLVEFIPLNEKKIILECKNFKKEYEGNLKNVYYILTAVYVILILSGVFFEVTGLISVGLGALGASSYIRFGREAKKLKQINEVRNNLFI